MKNNEQLLTGRLAAFNARPGARVGDYLQLPKLYPKLLAFTRLTHDWGDQLQTGGTPGGGYYFTNNGFLSYSGGLDPGVKRADIIETQVDEKPGSVWFFDGDISGAGRGVYFTVPMRVFCLREEVKSLDGIGELRCPYTLCVFNAESHARSCNYWYAVQHRAMAHTAFTTEAQLLAWLAANELKLTRPLTQPGDPSFQTLAYA